MTGAKACCLSAGVVTAGCAAAAAAVVATCAGAIVAVVSAAMTGAGTLCPGCSATVVAPMECAGLYASQGFGNTPWEHPHTGIDIVCPAGTPVRSMAAGVLHRLQGSWVPCLFPAGRRGGLGTYAEVDTGSMSVLYGHLSAYAAADGSEVSPGTVIGYEGDTGCATGPHLHLQVDSGATPVDPCPYLPQGYPEAHTGSRCWGAAPP